MFLGGTVKPTKKRNVRELAGLARAQSKPGDLIVIVPQWFDLNFTYYYNNHWFKDTKHMQDSLWTNNIHPVNDSSQLKGRTPVLTDQAFLVDAESDEQHQPGEVYHWLNSIYPHVEKHSFYDHLTVFRFSK
jgi:hypothetical protein